MSRKKTEAERLASEHDTLTLCEAFFRKGCADYPNLLATHIRRTPDLLTTDGFRVQVSFVTQKEKGDRAGYDQVTLSTQFDMGEL